MNLTADEAKKFNQQSFPKQFRYFLSFVGEVLQPVLSWGFLCSVFSPNTKSNLSRKRLITLDRRGGYAPKTGIAYETVDTGSAPWGFHFWPLNRHLTISTFQILFLVSLGQAVFNYCLLAGSKIQMRLNNNI